MERPAQDRCHEIGCRHEAVSVSVTPHALGGARVPREAPSGPDSCSTSIGVASCRKDSVLTSITPIFLGVSRVGTLRCRRLLRVEHVADVS